MQVLKKSLYQANFQGLAAGLFGVLAAFLLYSFLTWVDQRSAGPWFLVLILAAPIAIGVTRISQINATAVFGVILACGIAMLYLWIAHAIVNQSDTTYKYADTTAYGGIIFSAYVLFGLMFAIDIRRQTLRKFLALWIFTSAAVILTATAIYVFAQGDVFIPGAIMLLFTMPSLLHALAIWTQPNTAGDAIATDSNEGANTK